MPSHYVVSQIVRVLHLVHQVHLFALFLQAVFLFYNILAYWFPTQFAFSLHSKISREILLYQKLQNFQKKYVLTIDQSSYIHTLPKPQTPQSLCKSPTAWYVLENSYLIVVAYSKFHLSPRHCTFYLIYIKKWIVLYTKKEHPFRMFFFHKQARR